MQRCAGEESRPLRELVPGGNYRADEYARKDHFFSPYCGKDYISKTTGARDATEILSMGLQRLASEPEKFYNTDREYFNFCLGLVRGRL